MSDNKSKELYSFFAHAVHDLKAPLASISGYTNAMLDGTIPEPMHGKYLGIIKSESERMSEIISDLLELSKLESAGIPLKPGEFDLKDCILNVLVSLDGFISQKKLEISIDIPESTKVFADKSLIYRVVYNLVHNAIKFSFDGGRLAITAKPCQPDKYGIEVYNTGVGIPEKDIDSVFDKFYKSDEHSDINKQGTGLGLSIVSSIIKAHGESIRVSSEQGKYCSFVFTLPKA